MQLVKKITVVCAVLALSACASHSINSAELNGLYNGMSPAAVSQVVTTTPDETLSMRVNGQPITVQVYGSGKNVDYLAFHHNRLLYWGSPSRFAGSSDHLIRAVGRRATADRGASY